MNLDIRIDISRCKASAVGEDHGITPAELRSIEPRVEAAHQILRQERADGKYGFYDLYRDDAVFDDMKATAATFLSKNYENLVILGI